MQKTNIPKKIVTRFAHKRVLGEEKREKEKKLTYIQNNQRLKGKYNTEKQVP